MTAPPPDWFQKPDQELTRDDIVAMRHEALNWRNSRAGAKPLLFMVVLYRDGTIMTSGAKRDAIPTVMHTVADSLADGGTQLDIVPLN